MKKPFKETRAGKIITKVTDLVVDMLPLGTTIRKGIKGLVSVIVTGKGKQSFDFDGDGKVEWHEIAIAVAGAGVGVYLIGSGTITTEDLKSIFDLITK